MFSSPCSTAWRRRLRRTRLCGEPVGPFQLSASLGYTDAEYVELAQNSAIIVTPEQLITLDTQLPNAPEWQAALSAEYTASLSNAGELIFRGDWFYSDDVFNDAQNSVFLFQEAYSVLNGSVTYAPANGDWDVRAFVENAGDERYIVSGDSNYGIGFHEANFNRPREYGVELRVRW